jgi:hypothetical protein
LHVSKNAELEVDRSTLRRLLARAHQGDRKLLFYMAQKMAKRSLVQHRRATNPAGRG